MNAHSQVRQLYRAILGYQLFLDRTPSPAKTLGEKKCREAIPNCLVLYFGYFGAHGMIPFFCMPIEFRQAFVFWLLDLSKYHRFLKVVKVPNRTKL